MALIPQSADKCVRCGRYCVPDDCKCTFECVMGPPCPRAGPEADGSGVKVSFNPFAYSVEQNNEFLAAGYEVMPIGVPRG